MGVGVGGRTRWQRAGCCRGKGPRGEIDLQSLPPSVPLQRPCSQTVPCSPHLGQQQPQSPPSQCDIAPPVRHATAGRATPPHPYPIPPHPVLKTTHIHSVHFNSATSAFRHSDSHPTPTRANSTHNSHLALPIRHVAVGRRASARALARVAVVGRGAGGELRRGGEGVGGAGRNGCTWDEPSTPTYQPLVSSPTWQVASKPHSVVGARHWQLFLHPTTKHPNHPTPPSPNHLARGIQAAECGGCRALAAAIATNHPTREDPHLAGGIRAAQRGGCRALAAAVAHGPAGRQLAFSVGAAHSGGGGADAGGRAAGVPRAAGGQLQGGGRGWVIGARGVASPTGGQAQGRGEGCAKWDGGMGYH